MRTTVSSRRSAISEQPTPQYAQVVRIASFGWPAAISDFSCSAPVGQASTQAPQDTHSDSRKGSPCEAATRDWKPRFSMVNASVPCCSSQARTQREQVMHRLASNRK